jgi:hypothetical protein
MSIKGTVHSEIETVGSMDVYLERCCWGFIIFIKAPSIYIKIKIQPAMFQKLVVSHITNGDCMHICKLLIKEFN